MNQEELRKLIFKISKNLKDIGIPIYKDIIDVKINTRAKARFGACKKIKKPFGKTAYIIEISSELLCCSEEEITPVIIHELIHTCKGCFNHGKKWKIYTEVVREKLGYNISRTDKYETFGLEKPKEKESIKYIVKCAGCGQEFPRKRMCKLVENPERYRCGKCGNILYLEAKNHNIL